MFAEILSLIAPAGLVTAVALAAIMPGVATATPIVVNFSFSNTSGPVAGTVSGELDFASAGTGVAATGVYILSAPAGSALPYSPATNLVPIFTGSSDVNAFTVNSFGVVSAAYLLLYLPTYSYDQFYLNYSNQSELGNSPYGYTWNTGGFAGITFTPGTAVPEPMSVALFGAGLLGLAFVRRGKMFPE